MWGVTANWFRWRIKGASYVGGDHMTFCYCAHIPAYCCNLTGPGPGKFLSALVNHVRSTYLNHATALLYIYLIKRVSLQYRELLHASGRGIFTSRRRVKIQPTSAIIAICMLTSAIKCLLSVFVSSHTNYRVTRWVVRIASNKSTSCLLGYRVAPGLVQ